MLNLIKTTVRGKEFYINIDKITAIFPDGDKCGIICHDDNDFTVEESVKEILDKIANVGTITYECTFK